MATVFLELILLQEYNMLMIKYLYHGSTAIIPSPEYGRGKTYNDYGRGFYCTEDIEMAREWGARKDKEGVVNCYKLDASSLRLLNLNSSQYTILHWLAILLENRTFETATPLATEAKEYIMKNFHIPYEDYDLIQGYRADDSYFSFAQDFINGGISIRQLANAMRLGELGEQIVLKSKKAFDSIEFTTSEAVVIGYYYEKKMTRDKKAREEYLNIERFKREKSDLYIMQIMDEGITGNDKRIR